jgi:hypothetical protein
MFILEKGIPVAQLSKTTETVLYDGSITIDYFQLGRFIFFH